MTHRLPSGIDTALAIPQPWTTLIIEGPRRIWNLPRPPAAGLLGKRIALYAAAEPDLAAAGQAMEFLDQFGVSEERRASWRTRTAHGAIIGTVVLAGVFTASSDRWFTGPFGVWLTDGHALPEPVEMFGRSGFWRLQ